VCVSLIFSGFLRRPWVFNVEVNVILIEIHSVIVGYVSGALEGVVFFSGRSWQILV
jgi:hypothetical protein